MKPKIFLDFDGTLFDWHVFVPWLDKTLAEKYGIEPQSFIESYKDHHKTFPDGSRLYHHRNHIKAVTGRNWSEIAKIIEQADKRPHFCFKEVHTIVDELNKEYDVSLLTFGRDEFQTHKIGLCDFLKSFDTTVVIEPKGDFLAREFSNQLGVLIDDKYPLSLPGNWQHVWINRTESLTQPKRLKDGTWQISDLSQAKIVLDHM